MAEVTNKRGVPEAQWGTHTQRRRPADGWPNMKDPEELPNKRQVKARKRLEKRIAAYEAVQGNKKSGYHKPGSLKVK